MGARPNKDPILLYSLRKPVYIARLEDRKGVPVVPGDLQIGELLAEAAGKALARTLATI